MPRKRDEKLLRRVGQRVARARRAHGWSQEQLASKIDVEPVTLSRLENGKRALSLTSLALIADALGIGLGDLLDAKRDLPTPEQNPEQVELLRLFNNLGPARQDLVLRLTRELSE